MKKIHPIEQDGIKGFSPNDLNGLVQNIIGNVQQDDNDRARWLQRQQHYYSRRYCRTDRGTNYPWPGASDIVMPTIDMTIDRLKSAFLRLAFPGDKPAIFQTHRQENDIDIRQGENFFNWLITQGMKDLQSQLSVAFDYLLQYGIAPVKTFWDFRSRKVKRVIYKAEILRRYNTIIKDLSKTISRSRRNLNNNPEIVKRIGDETIEALRPLIARDYGLSKEEPDDIETLNNIMAGLKTSNSAIEIEILEIEYNAPRTIAVAPEDLIIPIGTNDFRNCTRKTHRLFLTESTFIDRASNNGWSQTAVNKVLDQKNKDPYGNSSSTFSQLRILDLERDSREGLISTNTDDLIEIWETHFWLPKKKNVKGGRHSRVWSMIHPSTGSLLKSIKEEPYIHGGDPFDCFRFEVNDDRYYSSRGVPEKIDDLDWEITLRHRAKLNKIEMMVPAFTKRISSILDPDQINWIPGEFYNVNDHDDLRPIVIPDQTLPDDREELQLSTWIERYLGASVDMLASQGRIHEARTATEISAIGQGADLALDMRIRTLHDGLRLVFDKIWDLWNQWGDLGIEAQGAYYKVTGEVFSRNSPIEIRNNYSIIPAGKVANSDPRVEANKAFNRYQTLLQAKQLELQTQGTIFNGTHTIDLGEALSRWLERDNFVDARALIRKYTPEEIQMREAQMAQEMQQAQEAEERRSLSEAHDLSAQREIEAMDAMERTVNSTEQAIGQ